MVLRRPAVTGLPRLDVGEHAGPEQGACLMEYVSVPAGHRFTDCPACTPGAVAVVVHRVNDAVSDRARPRLASWAPELVGAGRGHSGLDDLVVSCCTAAGLAVTPHERHLSALQKRACRRLRHPLSRWLRLPAHAVVHKAFIAAMAALAPLPADERDERLIGLLVEVVHHPRRDDGSPQRGPDDRRPPMAVAVAAPGRVEDARGRDE